MSNKQKNDKFNSVAQVLKRTTTRNRNIAQERLKKLQTQLLIEQQQCNKQKTSIAPRIETVTKRIDVQIKTNQQQRRLNKSPSIADRLIAKAQVNLPYNNKCAGLNGTSLNTKTEKTESTRSTEITAPPDKRKRFDNKKRGNSEKTVNSLGKRKLSSEQQQIEIRNFKIPKLNKIKCDIEKPSIVECIINRNEVNSTSCQNSTPPTETKNGDVNKNKLLCGSESNFNVEPTLRRSKQNYEKLLFIAQKLSDSTEQANENINEIREKSKRNKCSFAENRSTEKLFSEKSNKLPNSKEILKTSSSFQTKALDEIQQNFQKNIDNISGKNGFTSNTKQPHKVQNRILNPTIHKFSANNRLKNLRKSLAVANSLLTPKEIECVTTNTKMAIKSLPEPFITAPILQQQEPTIMPPPNLNNNISINDEFDDDAMQVDVDDIPTPIIPATECDNDFYYTVNKNLFKILADTDSQHSVILEKNYLYIVVDTNTLLYNLKFIENLTEIKFLNTYGTIIYIPYIVIQELDSLKTRTTSSVDALACRAIKFLNNRLQNNDVNFKGQSSFDAIKYLIQIDNPDDKILNCCLQLMMQKFDVILLSNDINLRNKAIMNHIKVSNPSDLGSTL